MKTLYLVRHAKSSWKYPELTDFDRPLNKRGKRDAPEMGRRLKDRDIMPDLMLSSPANRALTTCREIARQIDFPKGSIQTDHGIYHAGTRTLLDITRKTPDSIESLMMFGHNPGFTDFANQLAGTDIFNIPTCGIFACSFDVDHWQDVAEGKGRMVFYDYPKKGIL